MAGDANKSITFSLLLKDGFTSVIKNATSGLGTLKSAADAINKVFAPLNGTIATMVEGLASFAAVQKGLSLAGTDVASETRLKTILQDNEVLLQKRLDMAKERSKNSTASTTEITDAEATLRLLGVSDDQIDKALDAVMGRAAAFGTSIQEQVEHVGETIQTGTVGRLARTEAELSKLSEQQLKSGGAIDLLAAKYGKYNAQLANTPFGKAKQGQNQLDDALSGLGKTMVQLENAVVPKLAEGLHTLVDYLNTPTGQEFLSRLASVMGFIAGNSDKIIAVFLAIKGIKIGGDVLGGVTQVSKLFAMSKQISTKDIATGKVETATKLVLTGFAKFVAIGAIVTAAGAALAELYLKLTNAGTSIKDIGKDLADIWSGIRSGVVSIGDIFREIGFGIQTELKVLGVVFETYLFEVPMQWLKKLLSSGIDAIKGTWLGKLLGLNREEGKDIDFNPMQYNLAGRAIGIDASQSDALTTDDINKIKAEIAAHPDKYGVVTSTTGEVAKLGPPAKETDAVEQMKKDIAQIRADAEIEKATRDAIVVARVSENKQTAATVALQKKQLEQAVAFDKLVAQRGELKDKLDAAGTAAKLTTKQDLEIQQAANQAEFDEKKRSLEAFLQIKDDLETKELSDELSRLKDQLAKVHTLRVANEEHEKGYQAAGMAKPELASQINQQIVQETDLTSKVRDIQSEILAIQGKQNVERGKALDQIKQQKQATDAELDARQLIATGLPTAEREASLIKLMADQSKEWHDNMASMTKEELGQLDLVQEMEKRQLLVKNSVDAATEAEQNFSTKIDRINSQVEHGTILWADGEEQKKKAQDELTAAVQDTIEKLEVLKKTATDPQTVVAIDLAIQKIKDEAVKAHDSITTVGKQVMQTLESSTDTAFSSIIQNFGNARQAASQFFASVAKGLADIAAQLARKALFNFIAHLFAGAAGGAAGGGDFGGSFDAGSSTGGDFNTGGAVSANLTPREYVFGSRATSRLGQGFMTALNAMTVPVRAVRNLAGYLVPGGGPDRDTVTGVVPVGGFVIRRRAADYYGAGNLAKIAAFFNYNSGGPIQPLNLRHSVFGGLDTAVLQRAMAATYNVQQKQASGAPTGGASHIIASVVANEQTAERLFKGGDNAFVQAAGRNRQKLRNMLGISDQ